MLPKIPSRPRSTLLGILLLWAAFYASFTLFAPPLLDDADSVHAEVAREMLLRHDFVTLYANGIRYLEKAPLLYWSMAATMRLSQICGAASPRALAVAARIPLAVSILALALLLEAFARRIFRSARSGLYAALILLSSFGIFLFTRILIPDAIVCLFTTLALYAFWRTEEIDAGQTSNAPHLSLLRTSAQQQTPHLSPPRPSHTAQPIHVLAPEPEPEPKPARPSAPSSRSQTSAGFASATRRLHIISSRAQKIHVISTGAKPAATPSNQPQPVALPPAGLLPVDRRRPRPTPAPHTPEPAAAPKRPSLIWKSGKRASLETRDASGASEARVARETRETRETRDERTASPHLRLHCGLFAIACALNVLTKGLIGVVFPVAIVLLYLLLTRGTKRTLRRLRELHPWATLEAFLVVAAPWHILAGIANPTEGHPAPFRLVNLHWLVPLPTFGNVHGWFWFYFMNEHLLRYLNLRVPHDYDTSPLWLFWGLCLLWIMPWSAFLFKATAWVAPYFGRSRRTAIFRSQLRRHDLPLKRRGALLLLVWAVFVLLFFALSTRQEYYVLPALPALGSLIAAWLAHDSTNPDNPNPGAPRLASGTWAAPAFPAALRITAVLLILGSLFAAPAIVLLLRTHTPAPHTDLAALLTQHPSDYALSMGHVLDLDTRALGLFRLPLALAALSLFLGPLAALLLRRRRQPHAANLALAAGSFTFLLAAHLGLQTFAPVLTSAQLAEAIAPQVHADDLIVLHGEYESGSTLGFYLQRPATYASNSTVANPTAPGSDAANFIHILDGRSSNLWYGSFFTDAPDIFETPQSLAAKWSGTRRIFLWQSLTDPPIQLPPLPAPIYVLASSGGKEILSNQPNR